MAGRDACGAGVGAYLVLVVEEGDDVEVNVDDLLSDSGGLKAHNKRTATKCGDGKRLQERVISAL